MGLCARAGWITAALVNALLVTSVNADNFASGSPIPDYYDEPGFATFREQVASEDSSETVDPFSGRLHISNVDIDIPGNGGLDLKIIRSYNNIQLTPTQNDMGSVGLGWDITFGRVLFAANRGVCDKTVSSTKTSASDHVLQLPDGSRHTLYVANAAPYSSYVYVTTDRWVATCTTATGGGQGLIITSPQGVSYYMTQPWVGPMPGLMASKIVDRNGNTITINYVIAGGSLGLSVIGSVTTSDGRNVQFNYANQNANNYYLSSITVGTYTWTYQYQQITDFQSPTFELMSVTRPDQSKWQYTYLPSTAAAGAYSVASVTYPHGAQVSYAYQKVNFGYPQQSTSVSTKNVSGPNMASGAWSYTFAPGKTTSYDATTVKGPGLTYYYRHVGYLAAANNNSIIWEVGSLLGRDTYNADGSLAQADTYSWGSQNISTQTLAVAGNSSIYNVAGCFAPILTQHTVTRNGTAYSTTYSSYDSYGNAQNVSESGPAGTRSTSYTYLTDTAKWVVNTVKSQTISGIGTISNTFDSNDNINSTTRYGVATSYGHTSQGDISSIQNARGYTTSYSSYMRGTAQSISEPQSVSISKVVTSMGTVQSVRDGNGNTTGYVYDGLNRPTSITYPIHSGVSIFWSQNSINVTRGSYGETTTIDGLGHPVNINRSGISMTLKYDALGRKIFESYPCQASSCSVGRSYAYDALGRVTQVNNNGATRSFSYGSNGTVSVATERNYSLTYRYSAYGNADERMLVSVSTPTTSTSATYNAIGILQSVTQGSLTRSYSYNSNFFLTSSSDPEAGTTTYGRDAIGNMTSITVGNAGTTSYIYDGLNRRTSASSNAPSSSAIGPIAAPTTSSSYDYNSNVLILNSGCTNIIYQYDALDELTNEKHQDVCGGPTLSAGYSYDSLDHLSSLTYPSGRTINYAPDIWGRPKTAGPYVTNANYFPNGYVSSLTYGNSATEQQTLTSRQLVNTLLAKTKAGVAFVNFTYGYDNANNVTSIQDGVSSGNNLTLGYDQDDQLTSATGSFGSGSASYDGIGNIATLNLGNSGNFTFGYSSNRLSSVSGSKSYAVTYDGQGNAISDSGFNYIYDSENRLLSVQGRTP